MTRPDEPGVSVVGQDPHRYPEREPGGGFAAVQSMEQQVRGGLYAGEGHPFLAGSRASHKDIIYKR